MANKSISIKIGSGGGGGTPAYHTIPLQNVTELAALPQGELTDKQEVYVEDAGYPYFYNAQGVSGDIAPDDQAGGVGFWNKLSMTPSAGTGGIYGGDGNLIVATYINDNAGSWGGTTAGSVPLIFRARGSGSITVQGWANNGTDVAGTHNSFNVANGINVRGSFGTHSGGGSLDLKNSGGGQFVILRQGAIYLGNPTTGVKIGTTIGTPASTLQVVGAGATSATSSLLVQNSSATNLFEIKDNGDSSLSFAKTSGTFNFKEYTSGLNMVRIHGTGNVGKLSVLNGNFVKVYLSSSEGMFFNPAGTASGITQVGLGVTSDSHTILNARISTADITANITTPLAGMQVYDSTLNELQFYNGTSWVAAGGASIYSADGTIGAGRIAALTDTLLIESSTSVDILKLYDEVAVTIGTRSAGAIADYSFTAGLRNNATNVAANAASFAIGIDNVVSGLFAGALNSTNTSSGRASLATGESNTASGDYSFVGGYSSVAGGSYAFAFGVNAEATVIRSVAIGTDIQSTADGSMSIGVGATVGTPLVNSRIMSLDIGFRTTVPTLTVTDGAAAGGEVGIGNVTSPTARLHVKGAGATSATTSLLIEDSAGVDMFEIKDDGTFFLGKNAVTHSSNSVAIGTTAEAKGTGSIALGNNTLVDTDAGGGADGIAIGNNTQGRTSGIAIGGAAYCYATNISIGSYAGDYNTTNAGIVTIGNKLRPTGANSINLAARNSSGGNIVPNEDDTFGVYLATAATANSPELKFRVDNDSWWDSPGSFGFNTMTPDASALLDLTSTDKGFLPPRVANTSAVTSPATGLIIYDNSSNQWMGYNGTSWVIIG